MIKDVVLFLVLLSAMIVLQVIVRVYDLPLPH